MNHEPNLMHWVRGSIVIHDADAKEPKMLMKVIGFTRDGFTKTQYIDKRQSRKVFTNRMVLLHDPRRFDLLAQDFAQEYIVTYQLNFERVRRWNKNHPEPQGGVLVLALTAREGVVLTRTTSKALMRGVCAQIYLANGGQWDLEGIADVSDDQREIEMALEMGL